MGIWGYLRLFRKWIPYKLAGLMKALLYVRVSSQDQAEEGFSLESQDKEGEKYALRKGLKVVKKWEAVRCLEF